MKKNNSNYIYSTSKKGQLLIWFVVIVLLLFSYPIVTTGYAEANSMGMKLAASIIPLLAVFVSYSAIYNMFDRIQHGNTPLRLNHPTGYIGDHVSATILLNQHYRHRERFQVGY
jgi:hypothetical protein